MSNLLQEHYYFHMGDAATLIGVHKSTVCRWLNSFKMAGERVGAGFWIISLDEINRKRREQGLLTLTKDQADKYYQTGNIREIEREMAQANLQE